MGWYLLNSCNSSALKVRQWCPVSSGCLKLIHCVWCWNVSTSILIDRGNRNMKPTTLVVMWQCIPWSSMMPDTPALLTPARPLLNLNATAEIVNEKESSAKETFFLAASICNLQSCKMNTHCWPGSLKLPYACQLSCWTNNRKNGRHRCRRMQEGDCDGLHTHGLESVCYQIGSIRTITHMARPMNTSLPMQCCPSVAGKMWGGQLKY